MHTKTLHQKGAHLVLWVGTSYMIPIVYRYIDSYTALFLTA